MNKIKWFVLLIICLIIVFTIVIILVSDTHDSDIEIRSEEPEKSQVVLSEASESSQAKSEEPSYSVPEESSEEESPEEESSDEESSEETFMPSDSSDYTVSTKQADKYGSYEFEKTSVHEGTGIFYENNGKNGNIIVAIDAGHQCHADTDTDPLFPGSDTMKMKVTEGAEGRFSKAHEYELNLCVSLALRNELYSRGYSVLMIRETNCVSISNKTRALLANDYNSDIYIHIHADTSENPEINGGYSIVITEDNPTHPELADVSYTLAELISSHYCDAVSFYRRKTWKTDSMTGSNWASMPSVILEMGYMTNESDDLTMATPEFRIAAAKGIANGIDAYFN